MQIDGVAMGSPIASVVANIFMENFENKALESSPVKPRYWWRYVDDIFSVVSGNDEDTLLTYLNALHTNITFTIERESNGTLPFLDVLVNRLPGGRLKHTVYRKPTHTDRYLRADSHHHPAHLSSVPRALINRAIRLCDPQYIKGELQHVRQVLESNGYEWRQSQRVANSSATPRPQTVDRAPAFLPYIKGVTDTIGHLLRRRFSIKTWFRPLVKVRQLLRSPKDREPLGSPGVYEIPCDCGKVYVERAGVTCPRGSKSIYAASRTWTKTPRSRSTSTSRARRISSVLTRRDCWYAKSTSYHARFAKQLRSDVAQISIATRDGLYLPLGNP